MYWSLPALGAALTLVQGVVSEPTPTAQDAPVPRQLQPIHIRNYEASFGLQRRSGEQFSSLDLQTQSQLIYGSPLENEQLLLANMTLYAPDGLQMILLEEFDGLTSAVDCKGDDGMLSLTFKSPDAFNYAMKTWSFVNQKNESKFLVIANHAGCGPDDQRQPYYISNVREDTATRTTFLTSKIAPWSEVAGTYDMDFGNAIPYQRPSQLETRGLFDDIKGAVKGAVGDIKKGADDVVNGVKSVASDVKSVAVNVVSDVKSDAKAAATDVAKVATDVGKAVTGSADISKSVTFGFNAGTPNKKTTIFTDNTHLILDCINCFIAGSVKVTGHISVDHFKLKDLTLDGKPQGLNGAMELEAQITKYVKPDSLKFTKDLFSAPVPDAGIEVPGIFKIGAIVSYEVGVQAQLQGSATIDFGLGLKVPDSAGIHADILHPESSTAQGFSGDITPIFDVKDLTATVQFSAFAQPKLSFGVELTEIGTLDIALVFKMPQIALKFIAAYNESGLCSSDPGASKTGVEIETQIGLELDLNLDASLGPTSGVKPSYFAKLWSDYHTLSKYCRPLEIAGLAVPSNSLTALPPQKSSISLDQKAASFSLFTVTTGSLRPAPTYLSAMRSAAPLPAGNASGIAVPTGFLKSSMPGAAMSTGVFSTNRPLRGTDVPYPTGSGFQTIPSGTGTAASGILPPVPTGGSPLSPLPGSAASSGAQPATLSTRSKIHTKSTRTKAPYPTTTGRPRESGTGAASASLHRFRY